MTAASVSEIAAAFPWFFPLVAFTFGACIGSFLNVVIYRVPKNESIVTPGSHCGCGQPIKWHDNIPMLSWVLLRGRARCCGRPFSFRYPFVELLTALLFVACWLRYGASPFVALCGMVFLSALVAATFIDLDHFIIPDAFTLGLGATGLLLSLAFPALHGFASGNFVQDSLRAGLASLIGSFVGSALVLWLGIVFEAVLKKQAMGFGDVKFVGGIGAFCGWQATLFTLFGGAVVGTVWFFVAWIWQRTSGKASPMAPPVEKPQEEDVIPPFGWFDAFSLGAGVIAVGASFLVPALHGSDSSGVFLLDGVRSGVAALQGLLIGSGIVLWIGLLVEVVLKKDLIPFNVVKLAGAIGALSLWSQGILGVARGALLAAAAGGIACALWWATTRLQKKLAAQPPADAPTAEVTDEPPALGFGVHVPFGPMLAIAAAAYFLFFRGYVQTLLAEFAQLL